MWTLEDTHYIPHIMMLAAIAAHSTKNGLSKRKFILHNEKTWGNITAGLLIKWLTNVIQNEAFLPCSAVLLRMWACPFGLHRAASCNGCHSSRSHMTDNILRQKHASSPWDPFSIEEILSWSPQQTSPSCLTGQNSIPRPFPNQSLARGKDLPYKLGPRLTHWRLPLPPQTFVML